MSIKYNTGKQKVYATFLALALIVSSFLYIENFQIKDTAGSNYLSYTQWIYTDIDRAINYIEAGDLNPETVGNHLDKIVRASTYERSRFVSLNFHMILLNYYNTKRICNDEEYREMVLLRLKECRNALNYIFDDIKSYKEKHILSKIYVLKRNLSPDSFNGRIYYGYFTKKALNRKKYNSKFHETFYKMVPFKS